MKSNYPVVAKAYSLTLWYIKKISSLPKNHRFTLGEKIQNTLLDLLMHLSDAIYSKDKVKLLLQANKEIEKLRLLSKLLKDLTIISTDNFRFATNSLNEIGRMIGGWIKEINVR